MTCTLCNTKVDIESPFLDGGVYALNPITWRKGWMCGWCLQNALEEAKEMPARDDDYENLYDEYMQG